jgi:hypothetical protein
MLILLAIPVIVAVALVHRLVQAVAPSNLLVRRVRAAQPRWRTGAVLLGLATVLLLTMHVVADAVSAGAPGWLNLVVLVLAWDALKVGWLAVEVTLRWISGIARQFAGRESAITEP